MALLKSVVRIGQMKWARSLRRAGFILKMSLALFLFSEVRILRTSSSVVRDSLKVGDVHFGEGGAL